MKPTFQDALRRLRMAGDKKAQERLLEFYQRVCGRGFAIRLKKAIQTRGYR